MDIKELLGIIPAAVSILILVGCCAFVLIYLAVAEKEHKLLLSKELKARIELYKDIKEFFNK